MIILMSGKKRITIMVDVRVEKKLRARQSKEILESQGTVSLSRVVNDDLAKFYKLANFAYSDIL